MPEEWRYNMVEGTFWLGFICALCLFLAFEAAASLWRSHRLAHAQQFLLRAKQEVQEIAQLPLNNPYPVIQITKEGAIFFANPAALETFPSLKSQGSAHSVLQGALEETSREVVCGDKIFHQSVSETRVNGEDAYIIYCYDITERKHYEDELRDARRHAETARNAAEQAKEARGEFLANMSHELRTPMNGIIGLSGLLAESGLEEDKQNLVTAVHNSAKNLLILLNDILDFSKIEAGELTIENIPFDIRAAVNQVISLQQSVAAEKGLSLRASIAQNVPPSLLGDPSRLQQIMNNLINNALKFTEKGGVTLTVNGREESEGHFTTEIAVSDTGIGIPKDKQAAIFEKFQQADASTARKYGGTGLGLAITKDLARLMGGTISIDSTPGRGTTFTVTVRTPIAQQKAQEKTAAKETANGIDKNARLLIIDDHPVNLLFLRQTLKKMDITNFAEAGGGKQALEMISAHAYDLILMDCQMPEIDGYEASRRIRATQNPDNAPVIIAATADAMKGAAEKCRSAGMDDYISKPIDPQRLYAMLQKWIPAKKEEHSEEKKPAPAAPKIPQAPSTAKAVIDWNFFHGITDGDEAFEKELIGIFIENLNSDIAALQTSFENRDFEAWDSWVHKLYGACVHIGAFSMAHICEKGQEISRADNNKIPKIHQAVLQEYKRVQNMLETRKAAA